MSETDYESSYMILLGKERVKFQGRFIDLDELWREPSEVLGEIVLARLLVASAAASIALDCQRECSNKRMVEKKYAAMLRLWRRGAESRRESAKLAEEQTARFKKMIEEMHRDKG